MPKTSTKSTASKTIPTQTEIELRPDMEVPCVDMVRDGRLYYASKRTVGYTVVWDGFMDVQTIELQELSYMKATDSAFFKENWIAIPASFPYRDEVLKYLHIEKFYSDSIDPYTIDGLFEMSIESMVDRINAMSGSMRDAIAKVAREAVESGKLDSFKRIAALQDVLGCKLI